MGVIHCLCTACSMRLGEGKVRHTVVIADKYPIPLAQGKPMPQIIIALVSFLLWSGLCIQWITGSKEQWDELRQYAPKIVQCLCYIVAGTTYIYMFLPIYNLLSLDLISARNHFICWVGLVTLSVIVLAIVFKKYIERPSIFKISL